MGMWIAVFITLVVIGSVLWVKPSAREKALSLMRSKALSKGLKVRLLDLKLAAQLFPWIENYRLYVFYEKPVPSKLKPDNHKARVVRLSEDIHAHEIDQEDPFKQILEQKIGLASLPSSVEALVISASGISILWREQSKDSSLSEVESISDFLNTCLQHRELWVKKS
jgi:hypothetical protein